MVALLETLEKPKRIFRCTDVEAEKQKNQLPNSTDIGAAFRATRDVFASTHTRTFSEQLIDL